MKEQKPAEGISLRKDFGDSKFFQLDCTCGNEEDGIEFEVALEVETDMEEIALRMYATQSTDWWSEKFSTRYNIENQALEYFFWKWLGFWNGLFTRLRLTKDVWINGQVKYEGTTYMTKQQTLNFAETLKTALAEVEKATITKQARRDLATENVKLKEEVRLLKWQATQHD